MAQATRLICFSHGKSVKFPCGTSRFTRNGRFCQRLNVHGIMLLKIQSSCRNSRYSQLIKLNTNYSASKSRCSNQSSGRKEGNLSSSSNNGRTSEAEEVFSFSTPIILNLLEQWSQTQIVRIVGLLVCAYLVIPSAGAVELAKCIANPSCAVNVACLQTCNNRSDETECQVKCSSFKIANGDCAFCITFLLLDSLVNMVCMYIISSKIENKPYDYVFVYYRGRNDAWDRYGSVVVYTRNVVLPETIVPELERATQKVGRNFNKFIKTDNTYGPEPPLVERLEKKVEEGEQTLIREVEEIEGEVEKEVEKVGKTKHTLFQRLFEGFKELQRDKENFLKGLSKEEIELLNELKMEASEVEKLFGDALPIRKLR
ncbi:hypothetical protein V6N13_088494 [Hibiscus sabdariffa]